MSAVACALVAGRVALGLVFGFSGFMKAVGLARFARAVGEFRLLPHGVVAPLARGIVFAELAVATLLLLGVATMPALLASLALLVLFTAAIAAVLQRGQR